MGLRLMCALSDTEITFRQLKLTQFLCSFHRHLPPLLIKNIISQANMTSADWPPVDETLPSVEPSSVESSADLFVGDLLGDELIDIYNAAVVGGGDDDDMDGKHFKFSRDFRCVLIESFKLIDLPLHITDIPSLLASTPDIKKEQEEDIDQGAPSHDDGFGAFRSSNSFNDLTILPQPPAASLEPPTSSLPPSIAPHSVVSNEATKKRALEAATAAPAPKRRANPPKKGPTVPAPLKAKAKTQATAPPIPKVIKPNVAKQQGKKDTPNPLTLAKPQPSAIAAKVSHAKKATHTPVAPASAVAPRVPVAAKDARAAKTDAESSSVLSNPPTEADFKNVAQAAVSNLIMNAGSSKPEAAVSGAVITTAKDGTTVDTSTEHVKALTGSNWVSVCSGGDSNSSVTSNSDKMNNRARRQNLTPDERARQNRDRNREHARNTRLRKKAYVEELKRTLTALVAQRDAAELEKRHAAQRELEQREVRFRVIEEFLKLRARNERNFSRWAAILEDRFTFTLPLTDFRDMVQSESSNGFEQVLTGVTEAMEDANHLAEFIQSLSKHDENDEIAFAYSCDRKKFFMDNCHAVLEWTASTHGALKQVRSISQDSYKKFNQANNRHSYFSSFWLTRVLHPNSPSRVVLKLTSAPLPTNCYLFPWHTTLGLSCHK